MDPVALERDGGDAAGSITVLLVEDDDGDALLVEDELAERLPGSEVLRGRTLAEALRVPPEDPDCILLDLGLPDARGVEAVSALRGRFGGTPLVVLTGLADEAAGVTAVANGAQDYLVKGRLEDGRLARAIRYSIGRSRSEQAERELLLAEAQAREVERLERGLAPHPLIEDPSIWVASCNRPGRSRALLGGDFFDLVQAADDPLRAVIGDVCGHGPDEAAIGVSLRASWRALTLAGVAPGRLLGTLSRVFEQERHLPRLFATLCSLEVELDRGVARFLLAGHPRPLLVEGGEVRPATSARGGGAIGFGTASWPVETVELGDGWAILLYTDGIVEGRVGDGPERLGEERLGRLLAQLIDGDRRWREHPSLVLEALIERAEELNGGPLTDDVAMLMIGVRDAPTGR